MIPAWIWIIAYTITGVLWAVIAVYYNQKINGEDDSHTDMIVAMITIFLWPLLLGGLILGCIAAVPIYFGKKLYYRKTKEETK